MTAVSLIDFRPTLKEAATRPADRAARYQVSIGAKCPSASAAAIAEPAELPAVSEGQLWVIEISPIDELSTQARAVMTDGNVIIYDRSLEAIVAGVLPLGGYAEPVSSAQTVRRCVRLARDGWSVIRLVDRQTPAVRRITHLRELGQCWQRAMMTCKPGVFLLAGTGQNGRRITAASEIDRELAAAIDQGDLTVVFSAIGPAVVSTLACTLANGLAG
jgi:hypothetical protein